MDKDGMVYVAQAQRYLLEVRRLEKKVNRPITEHPDVQRLIGQVVELQAENTKLKEENRTAASIIKRFLVIAEALKGE